MGSRLVADEATALRANLPYLKVGISNQHPSPLLPPFLHSKLKESKSQRDVGCKLK